jgi:predicted phage terminase large subunit-like protein
VLGVDEAGEKVTWEDPRTEEGDLAWPERFPSHIVKELERDKGPYAYNGQYQQLPTPRGGSIIKDDYWQVWSEKLFPNLEYIVASLDSAYTEKETNDPSALTIWGVFRDDTDADSAEANDVLWQPRDGQTLRPVTGRPKIILMWAWEDWLTLHDLVERVISCCIKGPHKSKWGDPCFAVDRLLIESKASGISVYQEICRMIRGSGNLGVELVDPKKYGDKVARLHAVQHLFADKMVYAPLDQDGNEKKYVSMVIDQCAMFPNGARDDLVDSTSMAMRWLREMGFALRREENALAAEDEMRYISPSSALPLYQV